MFRDLDDTLKKMLDDPAMDPPLAALLNADVSFVTPDKNFGPAQPTVNLFWYEVTENRELRDPVPITETIGGVVVRKTPPLRVDCKYLVTAVVEPAGRREGRAGASPARAGAAVAQSLSDDPDDEPSRLRRGQSDRSAVSAPDARRADDADKNMGEFWSALGTPPRPAFYVTATVALDLGLQVPAGPPVVSGELRFKRKMPDGTPEPVLDDVFKIAGTVRASVTLDPIPQAEMTLVQLGVRTTTDEEGRFQFFPVEPGGTRCVPSRPASPRRPNRSRCRAQPSTSTTSRWFRRGQETAGAQEERDATVFCPRGIRRGSTGHAAHRRGRHEHRRVHRSGR